MKTFFVMWFSQGVSLIGTVVVEFTLAWYLTRTTGIVTALAFFSKPLMSLENPPTEEKH